MRLLTLFPLLLAGTLAVTVPPIKVPCGHITSSDNQSEEIFATLGDCKAFDHGAKTAFVHKGSECYFFKSLPDNACAPESLLAKVDGTSKEIPLPGEAASYFCLLSANSAYNALEGQSADVADVADVSARKCKEQAESCDGRDYLICQRGHWQHIRCQHECHQKKAKTWCE